MCAHRASAPTRATRVPDTKRCVPRPQEGRAARRGHVQTIGTGTNVGCTGHDNTGTSGTAPRPLRAALALAPSEKSPGGMGAMGICGLRAGRGHSRGESGFCWERARKEAEPASPLACRTRGTGAKVHAPEGERRTRRDQRRAWGRHVWAVVWFIAATAGSVTHAAEPLVCK